MNYFICGFSGAGKTSLLSQLSECSELSHLNFIDLDEYILSENDHYNALGDYIRDVGLDTFRKNEINALRILGQKDNLFISLGGGALTLEASRILKSFQGFWLNTSFEECFERIQGDVNRPLSQLPKGQLSLLFQERSQIFKNYPMIQTKQDILRLLGACNDLSKKEKK